jgi:hypothetical protein
VQNTMAKGYDTCGIEESIESSKRKWREKDGS